MFAMPMLMKSNGGGAPLPEGGAITLATIGGKNYRIHTFLASGDFIIPAGANVAIEYLLVAGGGGCAYTSVVGGGAGGGGVDDAKVGNPVSLAPGTYPVVVGTGGAAAGAPNHTPGSDGNPSTFNGDSAPGGGGGVAAGNGKTGGCGSGAGVAAAGGPSFTGGAGTSPYGFRGGNSYFEPVTPSNAERRGGGGGGAGAAGADGALNVPSPGGAGRLVAMRSDAGEYFGGGGGASGGAGGVGGGGTPTNLTTSAGTDGLGGGASGPIGNQVVGGKGGDGVVIIRYEV